MDLSIIIVNYKSRTKLTNCLASLRAADLGNLDWEIIIVENASGDQLGDLVAADERIKLIESPRNLGMGGGNNLGIAAASGKYILILNPDTIVNGPAIKVLHAYLSAHPEVGIVAPKLLYPDGSLQSSCARWPAFFMPILRRTFLGDYFASIRDRFTMNDFDHNKISPVDWLMGSCLMFKKEILLPIGELYRPRFDERFFMYFEDTDLCRETWTRGLQVVYNPEVSIIHDHQRESARHPWYIAIFTDKITWVHIGSWFKYFVKWGNKKMPEISKNKYPVLKTGLAVDIDETLSFTIGHMVERMMERFGNPENLTVKELVEKYRYTQNVPYWQTPEALEWVEQIVVSDEVQKELPLIEGADFYLRKINEIVPIAAYLTIRPAAVLDGTKHWLEKHNFPVAPIICKPYGMAHEEASQWKAEALQELYPAVIGLIDDNAKILNYLPTDYPGKIFLYDHHNNLGRSDVIACRSWLEVYKNIKNTFGNLNI